MSKNRQKSLNCTECGHGKHGTKCSGMAGLGACTCSVTPAIIGSIFAAVTAR